MLPWLAYAVVVVLNLGVVVANPDKTLSPVQVLETRQLPGASSRDALKYLRQDLVTTTLIDRGSNKDVYKTNGSLDLTWNDADLFS